MTMVNCVRELGRFACRLFWAISVIAGIRTDVKLVNAGVLDRFVRPLNRIWSIAFAYARTPALRRLLTLNALSSAPATMDAVKLGWKRTGIAPLVTPSPVSNSKTNGVAPAVNEIWFPFAIVPPLGMPNRNDDLLTSVIS